MREILYKSVNELKLDKNIKKVLVENEIDTVLKLCNHSRKNTIVESYLKS